MSVYIKNVNQETRAVTLASDVAEVTKEYIVRPHKDNTNSSTSEIKWVIATPTNNRQVPLVGEDDSTLTCDRAMTIARDRIQAEEEKLTRVSSAVTQENEQLQEALRNLFPSYAMPKIQTEAPSLDVADFLEQTAS